MNVLTLNAGSNSLKFEIVAAQPSKTGTGGETHFGSSLVSGAYDDIAKKHSTFTVRQNKCDVHKEQMEIRNHGHATELLFGWLEHGGAQEYGIRSLNDIERIGHRIVHGANVFSGPVRITDEVIGEIRKLEDLAPLHNASALEVIDAAQTRVRERFLMIAVFDTVFIGRFQTRPRFIRFPSIWRSATKSAAMDFTAYLIAT